MAFAKDLPVRPDAKGNVAVWEHRNFIASGVPPSTDFSNDLPNGFVV